MGRLLCPQDCKEFTRKRPNSGCPDTVSPRPPRYHIGMQKHFSRLGVLALLLGTACAPTTPPPPPKPMFRPVAESTAPLDTTPSDIAVLNRVSWGAETADAQVLANKSLQAWLDQQLNPSADDGLPPDAAAQIAAMEISQKPLVAIQAEVRDLQQTAQKAKGTPDFDADQ